VSIAASGLPLAQVEIQERTGESCVAEGGFCPDWIYDNFDRYVDPLLEHVFLTATSVVAGFVIAFVLAIVAHRRGWLVGPIAGITGILYTIPSISFFFLLIPVTGRGNLSAIIALTAYTLLILFRNTMAGLGNVPDDAKDAARGMGLTDRQMLWRVELPLAVPEILAGLRIATTTTIGLATLAFFAGAGGLGQFLNTPEVFFKSNMVIAGGLAVALAALADVVILGVQRLATPWRRQLATA
jgi:osmoprotectant transport system permease protein